MTYPNKDQCKSEEEQLARLTPDVYEPLNGPPHQVGHLSIAYFDDAVNSVRPPRHIHTEERARNRAGAVSHWLWDGRALLSGTRLSVQNEVPPLGADYLVLDTPDAKTTLDKTPVLLHLRDHRLDLLRVFNDGTDRGFQRLDMVFDEESPPPESPQFAYQICVGV